MQSDRLLATWLISHRLEIESALKRQLGPAAPAPGSPESEALRRFRSFLASALVRGESLTPALDGLRLNERRVMALIEAWSRAAAESAGDVHADLAERLRPTIEAFRISIRTTSSGRKQRGRPRATRRAVIAAIDRVADAFLAIDTESGEIVDANPAAGSLLGVNRDALLGVAALSFVEREGHEGWWTRLDAVSEDSDPGNFWTRLVDVRGGPIEVDATMTRFSTRGRVLALMMMRPRPASTPAAVD